MYPQRNHCVEGAFYYWFQSLITENLITFRNFLSTFSGNLPRSNFSYSWAEMVFIVNFSLHPPRKVGIKHKRISVFDWTKLNSPKWSLSLKGSDEFCQVNKFHQHLYFYFHFVLHQNQLPFFHKSNHPFFLVKLRIDNDFESQSVPN